MKKSLQTNKKSTNFRGTPCLTIQVTYYVLLS